MTTSVITGLGIVAPSGIGTDEYWDATLSARTAIRPISRFDASGYSTTLAGEVDRDDVLERVPSRLIPQTDRWTQLAIAASQLAFDDAGLDPSAVGEYGGVVVTASSSGGTEFGQREMVSLYQQGPRHVGSYQSIAWFYAATTGQLSIHHGFRGCSGVVVAEQAGGLAAVDRASQLLADGDPDAEVALTGGTDSALCPYALAAQSTSRAMSRSRDPRRAYLPFTSHADGHVPGEGGAILVLEGSHRLTDRPTTGYATVGGYGSSFDPAPWRGRPRNLDRAVAQALMDAEIDAAEIDCVYADGAGRLHEDADEAAVIRSFFGGGTPVTVPKAGVGRLYGGGASLDVATAALGLRASIVPPTPLAVKPDAAHGLNLVTGEAVRHEQGAVIVLSRGHGGFNAAMVLKRYQPQSPSV